MREQAGKPKLGNSVLTLGQCLGQLDTRNSPPISGAMLGSARLRHDAQPQVA